MKKYTIYILNKIILLCVFLLFITIFTSLSEIYYFIVQGFQGGIKQGILSSITIIIFLLIYYGLDTIKIKKVWSTKSSVGEIKVINYWRLNLSSEEYLYLDEIIIANNAKYLWHLKGAFIGKLEAKEKNNLIEAKITQKYLGLILGCKFYLNNELISKQ